MKIYNTLTKKKEDFVTIEPNKVRMYVCGPTVYNYIHIGNARPYVTFDTIRRYLEYKEYEVTYIQNFTDVDDKIIKKANDENVSTSVIVERYIKEAIADATKLNVLQSTKNPRVTEEMPEIIEMIKELQDKGYAYERNGTLYFNTQKFGSYGSLSKKNFEEQEAGARVEIDTDKENINDFVLWKPAKPNEPKWESPWGEGRPGWHIECSAMAKKYLGETIDIHAGGEDLIFPHHENEIAQSEAANGKQFVKYWLHNGFINVDNQKMSKSKGNFFLVREVLEKYTPEVVRFFLLSGHYRTPINFSDELLEASLNGLNRIKNCLFNIEFLVNNDETVKNNLTLSEQEETLLKESESFKISFESKMDNDFNTADAISVIFDFVKFTNVNVSKDSSKPFCDEIYKRIYKLCDILGIKIIKDEIGDTEKIESLIEKRTQAKKNKDFVAADEIRNELAEMGVILEDTRSGVRWSYKGR